MPTALFAMNLSILILALQAARIRMSFVPDTKTVKRAKQVDCGVLTQMCQNTMQDISKDGAIRPSLSTASS